MVHVDPPDPSGDSGFHIVEISCVLAFSEYLNVTQRILIPNRVWRCLECFYSEIAQAPVK
jgi:hypothetical protein